MKQIIGKREANGVNTHFLWVEKNEDFTIQLSIQSVDEIINSIEAGDEYQVKQTKVLVANDSPKYLRAVPDGGTENNLDSLPDADEIYSRIQKIIK